jgi:hypothetical protein
MTGLNGLSTLVQALATFLTGPFGVSLIVVAVASSFLAAALHWVPVNYAFRSLAFGAGAFSAAYLVNMIGAGG